MDGLGMNKNEAAMTPGPQAWGGTGESAPAVPLLEKVKTSFAPDRRDSYFALFAFVLGFLFIRWVFFSWQGWGVTLFTLLFCGSVTVYMLKKGVQIPRASWFWLAVVMLLGLNFSLWTNNGLAPLHGLLLFCSAVYWVMCAAGLLILGKTSDLLLLDGYNAMLVIPFSNFGCQYKSLALLGSSKLARGRQDSSVVLGLFLTFIVAAMVLPLLLAADSGGFAKLVNWILDGFKGFGDKFWETFWQLILAVPVAAYIFGLVAGSAHKRGTGSFEKDGTLQKISGLRILPMITVYILMGLLCTLYIVFIGSQVPYFFSAFAGQRPEGWQVYSEYARTGFFELCRIAVINLFVLTAANIMSQQHSRDSMFLKVLNALLAVLTLVLITTAFSKMALYIGAYGLSMRRLLPCVLMIFMAILCFGVIALQKWSFSITRLAVGVGAVMFCMLCLVNPDSLVARYNADRYLSGTLESFDVEILYRSGPAGVDPALLVYEQTNDPELQFKLREYLQAQQQRVDEVAGEPGDNWESARARHRITEYFNKQG
ncbi:MAG TPA: DUF4173 domain-containing protein [Bacillota bacterium]|jgi:hypothetical protein|nr:DUF4173 domain-containing protein [Peptococcaceae bacterium]HPZ42828.1 DUF4173 domain-containing protein [Bacillota bacterium]HQD75583.1 DUF4173 domain-containing protein [Bacillota bacterium]HUM58198.1 DUF4173 domain-containing protein [Bacillota bacterium]